ncbi:amidophosphoribosyltransferase [Amedibacillus dolichus]|uniref:Amidophosphoribosyltransferase n=1 Tax=Amedibacillus dolichus DSM 3991 TaxID=428127 RepID=A8RAN4_9FIRM|nr:amidophosphoribosyltransferase [Amedibacillus dolichus]EDP11684.1 amidophosphoribosyltransferase [Amedibacillus dolichus DSM 3991]
MNELRDEFLSRELHEECGIFGIYNNSDAASLSYYGLHALQHRGQEAAGIAACDTGGEINCYKGKGLLAEVFNNEIIATLPGRHAIGHVRYSTADANQIENVQPIMVRSHTASFAVAHNGQIVNAPELRHELEKRGSIFQGVSDSELLAHMIQVEEGSFEECIVKACRRFEGAFAFVILTNKAIYAVRDKNGLRPVSIAKLPEGGYCVSSETCAYDIVAGEYVRDLKAGEIVKIDDEGIHSYQYTDDTQYKMCAMEYIYFARPDSTIDGINVHTARRLSGRALAKREDTEADIVIGVPDSSTSAAIGFAEESGLPYEIGLIKNRYVGRTFIQPTQKQRERGVRMKLSAVSSIVKGKRVFMIDDSIVRGTTSKRIVQLLKEAGATEVHVRICSAPLISPCFYGVDTSTYDELISARLTHDELCEFIGADSLRFMEVDEMGESFGTKNLCTACFDGQYCTKLFSYGEILESEKNK